MNLTAKVIPAAMAVAVPSPGQRAEMLLRWRSMSGAAHCLPWHYFGNEGTTATDVDAGGVGRVVVGGDAGRLTMDYSTAYHVAAAGWRLWTVATADL